MSAWIVSQAHIDVLVQGLCESEHVIEDPNVVGRILWQENHNSVNYRYDESEQPPDYTYRRPSVKIDPAGLLKAIRCYSYQTCEHPEWPNTKAYRWINKLDDSLVAAGVDDYRADDPWGYEESDVHVRVTSNG